MGGHSSATMDVRSAAERIHNTHHMGHPAAGYRHKYRPEHSTLFHGFGLPHHRHIGSYPPYHPVLGHPRHADEAILQNNSWRSVAGEEDGIHEAELQKLSRENQILEAKVATLEVEANKPTPQLDSIDSKERSEDPQVEAPSVQVELESSPAQPESRVKSRCAGAGFDSLQVPQRAEPIKTWTVGGVAPSQSSDVLSPSTRIRADRLDQHQTMHHYLYQQHQMVPEARGMRMPPLPALRYGKDLLRPARGEVNISREVPMQLRMSDQHMFKEPRPESFAESRNQIERLVGQLDRVYGAGESKETSNPDDGCEN